MINYFLPVFFAVTVQLAKPAPIATVCGRIIPDAQYDTGLLVRNDSGTVLLTLGLIDTMTKIGKRVDSVIAAHPEAHFKEGQQLYNPYYLQKTPLLSDVINQSGWTPMKYYSVHSAYMTSAEDLMMVVMVSNQGVAAQSLQQDPIVRQNTAFLKAHQKDLGITIKGNSVTLP